MAFSGLKPFIDYLEKNGELIRINTFVNPDLEITEVTDRISKITYGGKALLFENNGTDFPLLINAFGSEKRMAMAFERDNLESIESEVTKLFKELTSPKDSLWEKLRLLPKLKEVSTWMPKRIKGRGKCQEIVMDSPDLGKLPVLKCWPADGGKFITLPAVHTVDPESGSPNVGMYRMQIFDKNLTGMHWHKHKTGANHFEKYRKLGKIMPVTVTLGGDPVYIYAATAPMPENLDEYLLSGFLRKKQVRLVKCLTNDLYVPEDVDFVIEGYVDTTEDLIWEGPFGDHTGFYSLADFYPKFHVTCISHSRNAVYPATIVGVPPMEDAYIGKATERIFTAPIRLTMIPELLDMDLPFAGVAHNISVVKIKKSYPGQAIKVMNALWGAGQMMFNKFLIIVDEEVDIHNYKALIKMTLQQFEPSRSLHFSKGPLDVLDHSSSFFAYGSKMGLDLTRPLEAEKFDKVLNEISHPEKVDFSEIPFVNAYFDLTLAHQIPVLVVSVEKNEEYSRDRVWKKMGEMATLAQYKLVVMLDAGVELSDVFTIVWLIGGNVDPLRDTKVVSIEGEASFLIVDATMKNAENDRFRREWPNIVVSADETIAKVDEIWDELKIGNFIPSPSLKFKPLIKSEGAVREERELNQNKL